MRQQPTHTAGEGLRAGLIAAPTAGGAHGSVWFCSALVNSDTLTVYYGVKQNQFTKQTPEPRASDPKQLTD